MIPTPATATTTTRKLGARIDADGYIAQARRDFEMWSLLERAGMLPPVGQAPTPAMIRQAQQILATPATAIPATATPATATPATATPATATPATATPATATPATAEHIHTVVLQLRLLKEQGMLVDIDISGLSMFTMQVEMIELGVSDGDARGERLRAGQRLLLPQRLHNRIRACGNALRRTLDAHSFQIAQFGGWRWIPHTAWASFQTEFERRRAELDALREEIITGLPQYRAEALSLADKIASELWKITRIRRQFPSRDALRNHVRGRVDRRFPDEEKVRNSLRAVIRTGILMTSADTELELAAEAEARARRNEIARQERLADAAEQAEHERIRAQTEAMRQAALDYAREQVARELAPFDAIFADLRSRVWQEANEILAAVQRNGALNPKTRERLLALVDMFRHLNIRDDQQLASLLDQARAAAQGCPVSMRPAASPDAEAAVARLSDALQTVVDACADTRRKYTADPRMDGIRIL